MDWLTLNSLLNRYNNLTCITSTIADGDEDKVDAAQLFYNYATAQNNFEISGHPDIFKFILKDMTNDAGTDNVYESGNLENALGVIGLLVYHEDVETVIIAGTKEFVERSKNDKKIGSS